MRSALVKDSFSSLVSLIPTTFVSFDQRIKTPRRETCKVSRESSRADFWKRSLLGLLDLVQFAQISLNAHMWVHFSSCLYRLCMASVNTQFPHSCVWDAITMLCNQISTSVLLIRNKTAHNTNSLYIGTDEGILSSDSFVHTAMNRIACLWTCCSTDLFLDANKSLTMHKIY